MTAPPAKPQSAVNRIAQGLRTIALSLQPGDYVGSEESLSRQFNVTGPTLRQAVRLLEHEQIIEVRRGVRGGYFADRPNIDTISRVAAVYLRSRLGSFDEISAFVEFIQPLLVDTVLASDRLEELRPYAFPERLAETHDAFVAEHSAFVNLLYDIPENAPLQLVHAIFFQVGNGIEMQEKAELTDGARKVQADMIALAKALLAKERDRAVELAIQKCRTIHDGIKQNLKAAQERLAPGPTG